MKLSKSDTDLKYEALIDTDFEIVEEHVIEANMVRSSAANHLLLTDDEIVSGEIFRF